MSRDESSDLMIWIFCAIKSESPNLVRQYQGSFLLKVLPDGLGDLIFGENVGQHRGWKISRQGSWGILCFFTSKRFKKHGLLTSDLKLWDPGFAINLILFEPVLWSSFKKQDSFGWLKILDGDVAHLVLQWWMKSPWAWKANAKNHVMILCHSFWSFKTRCRHA